MSDLFGYLDCSGPLYTYLGHFRQPTFLHAGHNDGAPSDGSHPVPHPIPPTTTEDRNEINPTKRTQDDIVGGYEKQLPLSYEGRYNQEI